MHCRKEVSMSRYSAQQSSISENNRSRILQYLYHNGICSRAQIAKAIKLTPAAITKITAKLLAQGIIEETGDMDGDKNRRSIGLNLNCAKYHIIGVKFARSLVQIAVFDLKCNRIFLSDLPTVSEEHIPETVERIRDTVRQLIKDDPSIVAVGMAVPGPYLKDEGRTALVSSMQGWRQINFIDEFSNAFSVPVFVEQDARAGALAGGEHIPQDFTEGDDDWLGHGWFLSLVGGVLCDVEEHRWMFQKIGDGHGGGTGNGGVGG